MFSKAVRSTSTKRFIPLVNYVLRAKIGISPQLRNLQSPKITPETQSVLDRVTGVYSDPKYKLDLKPLEFRDGQYKTYFHIPVMCVYGIGLVVCFWCACCIVFYTLFDSQVNIKLHDNMQCLKITNGRDLDKIRNPWFMHFTKMGFNFDLRTLFYDEIEDAIQRRQEMDKVYYTQDGYDFEYASQEAKKILQSRK